MKQRTITSLIYRVVALALAGLLLVAGLNIFYGLHLRRSVSAMREVSLANTRLLFQVNSLLREESALVNTAPSMSEVAAIKQNQERFAKLGSQLNQSLDAITKLSTDAELAGLIKSLKERSAPQRAAADKVFSLAAGFQQTEAVASLQATFAPADEQLNQTASQATTRTLDLVDQKPVELQQLVSSNARAGIALSLATLVTVLAFSAWTVQRGILRPLRRMVASLNETGDANLRSADQVSNASQTLAEGSSEQAASIEETSSSLEELSSMTKRNTENSQKANDLSKQTRAAADKGVTDMEAMTNAMQAIKVSSDDISKIIKTIDEIAFQTNILALNAAVEAARAGEAGMGFAVVAEEVRNLAQRSAQAAKETAAKIEGAIAKTAQGVELSGKVSQALNDIVVKARQVDELAAEVAGASQEQTQGITQINTAVGQMDKVTQSNAATAEESASAAQELKAQAELVKHTVCDLTELVGGGGESVPSNNAESNTGMEPSSTRPAGKRSISMNGHGRNVTRPALGTSAPLNEIPLDEVFENF